MGALNWLAGHERVYLDANVLICAVEAFPLYREAATSIFDALSRGEHVGVTSELTLAEVLVKPLRDGHTANQHTYQELLSPGADLEIAPVNREVLIEAARLRSISSLKLPDAIHAATARCQACTALLTNDKALEVAPGISVMLSSRLMAG